MNDIQIPDFLKKSLASGEVIPLIGAGVSMSIKTKEGEKAFPSWSELLFNAAEKLEKEDSQLVKLQVKRGKLQRAAEEAQELLTGRPWGDFLNSQFSINFKELDVRGKALPKAIWRLSNRVVTLNYDKVLEWAHEESANLCVFDNSNCTQLSEFSRPSQQEMLWHLHGTIEHPKHMVLTPQSYHRLYEEEAEKNYKAALTKFREVISNKIILFIGCSLDDAELLAEIVKQNELFDGNTGPHYALVRKTDEQEIKSKLTDSHVQTITFSDFGQPLIDAVTQLAECKKQQQLAINNEKELNQQPKLDNDKEQKKKFNKISLFTASPLDKPLDEIDIIAKLKKYKYPIFQQAFTENNLMQADDYSIILLLAKKTNGGLLIEDDNACSDYLTIEELEQNLPVNAKLTVLITDKLLSEQELKTINFPLLVLPVLNKQGKDLNILDKLTHQLFKKQDIKPFVDKEDIQLVQVSDELLKSLNPENRKDWLKHNPVLPRDINSSELQGFTGRLSDLADISQKLTKAANGQRLLTIKGSGGLGKTTIAKKVALELANRGRFDAGVYFVDCESITSVNQLEMHIGEAFKLRSADDLFGYLAQHHDQLSRLLIFDNLESLLYLKKSDKQQNKQAVDQVKILLSRTLMYANVLVTSREIMNTEWEDVLSFRQMESEEALTLFNRLTKNNYLNEDDQGYVRRKILEPLLNNNPLAIKLICDGMPNGKCLKGLKKELEDDFFGKVKEEDLILMFDDEVDANINRQESLYVSILYSYETLNNSQKRALESFSLFPDGIDLKTFKALVAESKKSDRNQYENKFKKPVSDKDITVLANKSLIESNNGIYSLQSVIQRFSRFRFDQNTQEKDKIELFRGALRYNEKTLEFIQKLERVNKKAIPLFLSIVNNLFAAITYGTKENVVRNSEEIEDYFHMVRAIKNLSITLNLSHDFLTVLNENAIEHLITENNKEQLELAWQLFKVSSMYYNGEFDTAYSQLNSLIPVKLLMTIYENDENDELNNIIYHTAQHVYSMEGDIINNVLHIEKFNQYRYFTLVASQVQTAMNVEPLMKLVIPDLDYFEAQSYLSEGVDLNQINKVIDELHENEHLDRVNLTYIKSRDEYVNYEVIEKLVNVNPYTRGLKRLMYALSFEHKLLAEEANPEKSIPDEHNIELNNRVIGYYQSALTDLKHIKFYYVQALYFYARFLQKTDNKNFEKVYENGLQLTKKHHYRLWQHKFHLLKQPALGPYKPENYPLPDNLDLSPLIEKQVKWIKDNYGTSLNPFNKIGRGSGL
ncbi:SIR2 family protein [Marinicellulosiphila megalodicopiae]|uniref:SIR2 family protein n=1 Tax=Marinicellulosiphila megalodicopiae TaxID=2724896 RepID=UPI003BB0D631